MTETQTERNYHYFVDGTKYEVNTSSITGNEIKSRIANFDRLYALYLEGHGSEPDKLITDGAAINLERGPHKFYTVPPASFGQK